MDAQNGPIDDDQNEFNGFLFDSPQDIRRKVELVSDNGVRGVFVWELGHDKITPNAPRGVVIESIHGRIFETSDTEL